MGAMATIDLFQALWDSRLSFDGRNVVRGAHSCTAVQRALYVTTRDLEDNYAVRPPACTLQL